MYEVGTVVTASTRRGRLDAVVVSHRRISRGRFAGKLKYTLAPLNNDGEKRFYIESPADLLAPCKRKYSKKQIDAARGEQQQISNKRSEHKRARTQRNYEHELELSKTQKTPEPGDEVLINFSDGKAWRVVGAVRNGRIGLMRADTEAIRERNRRAERSHSVDLISQMMGLKPRKQREYRWLDVQHVLEVRKPK